MACVVVGKPASRGTSFAQCRHSRESHHPLGRGDRHSAVGPAAAWGRSLRDLHRCGRGAQHDPRQEWGRGPADGARISCNEIAGSWAQPPAAVLPSPGAVEIGPPGPNYGRAAGGALRWEVEAAGTPPRPDRLAATDRAVGVWNWASRWMAADSRITKTAVVALP